MKMTKARLALYTILACLLLSSAIATAYAKYTSTYKTNKFTVYVTAGTVDLSVSEDKSHVVIPGTTIDLSANAPTVTVSANSEACYVFLKVSNNVGNIVSFAVDTVWTPLAGEEDVYYKEIGEKTTDATSLNVVVNKSILVPHTVTAAQIESISESSGNNTIVFTAYAVQKTIGIETPIAAWNALSQTN